MKILVTGAGGMLGSALVPALRQTHEVVTPKFDVRSRDAVCGWMLAETPELVIHLAAQTDLELCERHPEWAYDHNVWGTINVVRACRHHKIPIVYISTAGIFDGEKAGAYLETDSATPCNIYGWSKLRGEDWVRHYEPHFIVRAGWMIGGGPKDHKFVGMIAQQVREKRPSINAVADRFGSPTYTADLARNLAALIATERWGTYHMAGAGAASRFDVACEVVKVMGVDINVNAVPSEYFTEKFPVPRARSEVMENRALTEIGLNLMRPWREALQDYLRAEVMA